MEQFQNFKGSYSVSRPENYIKYPKEMPQIKMKGRPQSLEDLKKKGRFLVSIYSKPRGPFIKDNTYTPLAMAAVRYGERPPKNKFEADRLVAKGLRMLDRYARLKRLKG